MAFFLFSLSFLRGAFLLRGRAPTAVVKKKQKQVNDDYHKRAVNLDEKLGTAVGSTGPFKKELNQYGQKGRVAGPVVGAFAEMSLDTYAIADLVASVLAAEHCSYYSEAPSDAKALFTQQLYRSLGLTAHLGWARLLVDRHRDLVQVPAAAGQHTSGSRGPHPMTRTRTSTATSSTPTPPHTPMIECL